MRIEGINSKEKLKYFIDSSGKISISPVHGQYEGCPLGYN